jgi:FRG domain
MKEPLTEYVRQLDLRSWSEFKSKVGSFQLEWIYRGQARASWTLASSLERSPSLLELDPEIETRFIAEYRKAIRSFKDCSEVPETTLEWLALLQHHGTPTRLIDCSLSPYVAAYFAFQEEHNDQAEPVAIWCVNRIRFYQAALYYLQDKFETAKWIIRSYLYSTDTFETLFPETGVDCVMPFDLARANQRQLNQQAVFLAAMNPHKTLTEQLEFLDYQDKPIVTKLTIPRRDRSGALRDLMKMNITHATLFPGIDGFSRSLNLKYSTLATIGDIAQWHEELRKDGFVT